MLALGLAGLGAATWIGTHPSTPIQMSRMPDIVAPPQEPVLVNALTAARSMRAGALVRPEDFGLTQVPSNVIPADSIPATADNRTALVGSMMRRGYRTGEMLLSSSLMRPGDRGFLAAVLAPGMRGVSVAVDAVLGAGGLIWPSDHVDMLLTQSIEDTGATAGRRFVGETILLDLRIVAVDRNLVQGAVGDVPDGAMPNASVSRTVTVEVTTAQAERVAVATRLGRLSFSVRAASGTDDIGPVRPATWARDVSAILGGSTGGTVTVFGGSADKKDFKF